MKLLEELPLFQSEGERAFLEFHEKNPQVYALLRRLAFEWKDAGGKKLGMRVLYERARWEFGMKTTESSPTLNNNHAPFYARLMMDREPVLKGFFEIRERSKA
jgi:hypothetical protein